MNKLKILFGLIIFTITFSFTSKKFPSQPPTGHTGSTGVYCTSCHGGTPLNDAGGSVTVNGLPSSTFKPDSVYIFSLKILHGINNRERWGFSIIALDDSGNAVGKFNTTNNNAIVNGDELSHYYAVTTNTTNTYTYNNLSWKAPSTNQNIKFYYVGMASNNSSGTDDDYVYSNSLSVILPIKLKDFKVENISGKPLITWISALENNSKYFEIERSDDGQFYYTIDKVETNSVDRNKTYTYLDKKININITTVFYRLKTIDINGKINYSKSIKFHLNTNTDIIINQLYPTIYRPGDNLKLEVISEKTKEINIILFDAKGIKLIEKKSYISKGKNLINLTLPYNLQKGIYYINCNNKQFIKTFGIIIQ